MESTPAVSPPNILKALGFQILSQGISLYKPTNGADAIKTTKQSPTLIIICSWAFAQPKHIAKYIRPYLELYPGAAILLVQNEVSNMIWRPDSWQMSFFETGAVAIQAHLAVTKHPQVLLHVFSNGGSHGAVQLSQACRATCGGLRLPVDAIVFDSCPGQPRFAPTIKALVQAIPSRNLFIRGIGTTAAYASVTSTGLCHILGISELAASKLYRKLNDPLDVFLLKTLPGEKRPSRPVPRTYIFSESDDMIMVEDIIGHARIARDQLLVVGVENADVEDVVQLEQFSGTGHVNHIKDGGQKYWDIVQDTWSRTETVSSFPSMAG